MPPIITCKTLDISSSEQANKLRSKNIKSANFSKEILPEEISGTTFYHPAQNPNEEKYQQVLSQLWKEKYDVNR